MNESAEDESATDRRHQEMIIMEDRPHIDGLTRGTVVEYDGWQWGVVTEIAKEMDPTKIGFVLLDELGDWVVSELEEARGCWEHYEAVRTFRDGEHEYWTSAEYIQDDDMWEILGPIHPDARDDEPELATDGGVDQSEAEISQTFRCECGGDVKQVDYLPMGTGESTHFRCTECDELGIRDIIPSPGVGERLRGVVRRED